MSRANAAIVAWLSGALAVSCLWPRSSDGGGARSGGLPLQVKQSGSCRALAPQDWFIQARPQGDAADLNNLAKNMYAGYGIRGIDRTMQPVYGDLFGDPETVLRAMIRGGVTNEPIAFTSPPQLLFGYFTLRFFESAGSRGLVAYRLGPGWQPDSYVMSWRTAVTTKNLWQTGGGRVAFAVAMSILCSVKVGSPDPIGKGRRESLCGGYNKQLGTEYAHSPTTGENVLVSPGTDWNEIGPQGPGYYRPKGGTDYEKLQPGRSDC